jgi:hypothetical protein
VRACGRNEPGYRSRAGAVPRKIMGKRDWLIIAAVVVVVVTLYFLKVF